MGPVGWLINFGILQALCVYWTASNLISLAYSVLFRAPPIRRLFNIPKLVRQPKPVQLAKETKEVKGNVSKSIWRQ